MKNNFTLFTLCAFAFVLLTFNSCKKQEVDNETQTVVDNTVCESEFMRMQPTVNGRAVNNPGVKKQIMSIFSACPNVLVTGDTTWTNQSDLPTMTFDYGLGCTDMDGRIRSGQMIAKFSKPYDSTGCVVTVTFNNFYCNGSKYEGTVQITRLAAFSYNTKVINGKCTGSSGWVITYDCDRTLTMTAGSATLTDDTDDVFTLTGTASGTNRNGKHFTVNITSALTKMATCKWLSAGKLEVTPEGLAVRTVDYGNGTCDNKATFSVNGNSFEFTMN
jgi:hypothetical protein